jgi:hypothetical protein
MAITGGDIYDLRSYLSERSCERPELREGESNPHGEIMILSCGPATPTRAL